MNPIYNVPTLGTHNAPIPFAQQAYTAVGNRDRKIMCDPYLLGFEIVDKNEDNNRLVGVFAFRISGDIYFVPVFYLNGQIKGHDLIYRKSVNRFYPNTEKWIAYFVGKGDDANGRPVDRRSNRDARIHLGIDRMSRMPGYKSASDEAIDIAAEWKQACDNSGFQPAQYFFADFLVDQGLQKAAANLADKVPWFADAIVLGELLDKPLTKQASAPKPGGLEYHVDPPAGATPEQVSAHYTRGYTLVDKRAAESLATAVDSSPVSQSWSSLRKIGVNHVAARDGSKTKVLWAPTTGSASPIGGTSRHKENYQEYRMVFLEGPDKGTVVTYRHGCAESELPLFANDGELVTREDEPEIPGDSSPSAGKAYVVWLPELGKIFGEPFFVQSKETGGDVTKLNFEKGSTYGETGCRVILRKDLDATILEDFAGNTQAGLPRVFGSDAVWIPVEAQFSYEHGMPQTTANSKR